MRLFRPRTPATPAGDWIAGRAAPRVCCHRRVHEVAIDECMKAVQSGQEWLEALLIDSHIDASGEDALASVPGLPTGSLHGLAVHGPSSQAVEEQASDLYSYLLQGASVDGFRSSCDDHACCIKDKTSVSPRRTVADLVSAKSEKCQRCRQPLQTHRASYLRSGRRILLSFHSTEKKTALVCSACKGEWPLSGEKLLSTPASTLFAALWTSQCQLPCGHSLLEGVWLLEDAMITLQPAQPVKLSFRGPSLCPSTSTQPEDPAHVLQEKCLSILKAAEGNLEKQMKALLTEFRKSAIPQQQLAFRCQMTLAALYSEDESKYSIRRIRKLLQTQLARGVPHKFLQLGVLCNLTNCLVECYESSKVQPRAATHPNAKEDLSPRSQKRPRATSAPPRLISAEEAIDGQASGVSWPWLDDLSLGPLLHQVFDPIYTAFAMQPIGSEAEKPLIVTALSRHRSVGTLEEYVSENSEEATHTQAEEWRDLCLQTRKLLLLEEINIPELYELKVAPGVHGTAIPLPSENDDDVGTVIAHGLLRPTYWKELCDRLDRFGDRLPSCCKGDRCHSSLQGQRPESRGFEVQDEDLRSMFADVPDEPIHISVNHSHAGLAWQLTIKNPLHFHILRHVTRIDDVEFASMVQHAAPLVTSGGKSKAGFWISPSGKVVLKTIKDDEANKFEDVLVGPLVDRLATTAPTGDSALCEILGLFTLKSYKNNRETGTREILVMRNIKYDIHIEDGECKYFDLKGVGRHRTSETPKSSKEDLEEQTDVAYLPTHLDGIRVLERESDTSWKATNDMFKATTDGLAYRKGKRLDARWLGLSYLGWGKMIEGTLEDDGWVRVQFSKALACSTVGCTRQTWNGQPGEACCRVCKEDGGSHNQKCEEKWVAKTQDKKPTPVLLDAGFTDALGGVPLPLRRADYEKLQQILFEDTKVLEELGIVDYSMMLVLHRGDQTEEGWIRFGVIDYLQPYNFKKQVESKVKILFKGYATVVKPELYRQRFCDFLMQAFELDPSPSPAKLASSPS